MSKLTFGQIAVGVFPPSQNASVNKIKQQYADIIDTLNDMRNDPKMSEGVKRHCSIAISDAETAQMRAVKALTWTE